ERLSVRRGGCCCECDCIAFASGELNPTRSRRPDSSVRKQPVRNLQTATGVSLSASLTFSCDFLPGATSFPITRKLGCPGRSSEVPPFCGCQGRDTDAFGQREGRVCPAEGRRYA